MQAYNDTDEYIHWLSQVIAKANRTFVPKEKDDSHTNLYYDSVAKRLKGRWIQRENDRIMLTLKLTNLNFEWVDDTQRVIQSHESVGKTRKELEKEIAFGLERLGLEEKNFRSELHFQIPKYEFAEEKIKMLDSADLGHWRSIREFANEVCLFVLGYLQTEGEIRIWPHHFDTGIYIKANSKMNIGFGLAMIDEMVEEPYFYMVGYPNEGEVDYKSFKALPEGEWLITDDWKGSILRMNSLNALPKHKLDGVLNEYIMESLHAYL